MPRRAATPPRHDPGYPAPELGAGGLRAAGVAYLADEQPGPFPALGARPPAYQSLIPYSIPYPEFLPAGVYGAA